jgi:hypothetical protein
VEWADGGKEWWIQGRRHREGGPALIFSDGSQSWTFMAKGTVLEGLPLSL